DAIAVSTAAADAMKLSIDGGTGIDTLSLSGGAGADLMQVSANGTHASLSDATGSTIDVDGTEHIVLKGGAGADSVFVNAPTGTAVPEVPADLGAPAATDIDTVQVNASPFVAVNDTITIGAAGGEITVTGLAAETAIDNAGKADIVAVNGFGGDDTIDAS